MLILVLESSTSSAKAMLYCSEKGVIDIKTKPYLGGLLNNHGSQDSAGIFGQIIELGKLVAEGHPVDMISLSGIWHSILLCDKAMNPITRTFSWEYLGATLIAKELRKSSTYVDNFYQKTGCMVHAMYPAFKLMYLRQLGYKLEDYNICSQGSYNFFRMTDSFLETESMASGSGLMNIHEKAYDFSILNEIGINQHQLGSLVGNIETRPLNHRVAALIGIDAGIPVLPANPDGGLNQVGAGALKNGDMTFSVGTSTAIRVSSTTPKIPLQASSWCYLSPHSWLIGAATSGACNCVDWIKNRQYSSDISYLQLENMKSDPDNMPLFLPFLYGERCPGWQDERYAGFVDIKPSSSNSDFYLSVLEGVIFNIYQCYRILCLTTGEPEVIKLSGGILNSPKWTQMCCDIFQKEMVCSNNKQISVLGGAVLALNAGGEISGLDDFKAIDDFTYSPNPGKRDLYENRFQRYLHWYETTGIGEKVKKNV